MIFRNFSLLHCLSFAFFSLPRIMFCLHHASVNCLYYFLFSRVRNYVCCAHHRQQYTRNDTQIITFAAVVIYTLDFFPAKSFNQNQLISIGIVPCQVDGRNDLRWPYARKKRKRTVTPTPFFHGKYIFTILSYYRHRCRHTFMLKYACMPD